MGEIGNFCDYNVQTLKVQIEHFLLYRYFFYVILFISQNIILSGGVPCNKLNKIEALINKILFNITLILEIINQ